MRKKGEFDYIPYIIGFMAILVLAAILILILTLTSSSEEPEVESNTTQQIQQNTQELDGIVSSPEQQVFNPGEMAQNDCLIGETYNAQIKKCVLDCPSCNQNAISQKTNKLLQLFYASNNTELVENRIIPIAKYTIEGTNITNGEFSQVNQLSLQRYVANKTTHNLTWETLASIFPIHQIPYLNTIHIVSDMNLPTFTLLKAGSQLGIWELYVDIRATYQNKTFDNRTKLSFLSDYGVLLALDPVQISEIEGMKRTPTTEEAKILQQVCDGYFSPIGCMKKGSYLNDFYDMFWAEYYDEWIDGKDVPSKQALFYTKYKQEFVTEKAATSPEVDFAQSWVVFVLSEKPTGNTLREQKISFFYKYPQFTRLRDWIRSRI